MNENWHSFKNKRTSVGWNLNDSSRLFYQIYPSSLGENMLSIQYKERDVALWQRIHLWCNGPSDRSFMVDPLEYFSFQPVLHNWYNKGCGVLSCVWDDAYKRSLAVN